MSTTNRNAIGPGEDIDTEGFEFSRSVFARGNGVLFSFIVDVAGEQTMKIVGKFPDEKHSDRPTGKDGRTEPSIYTQADIADTFIKGTKTNSRAGSGQWRGWALGNINSIIDDFQPKVKRRLKLRIDEQVLKAKKEWSRILRGKTAQQQIKPLKEAIRKARMLKAKYFLAARTKMPEVGEESGSIERIEAVADFRRKFYAQRKRSRLMAREQASKVKSFLAELDELKRSIVAESRSKEWADAIGDSAERMNAYYDAGNYSAWKTEQERYVTLSAPFHLKANIHGILKMAASEMKSDMYDILVGMKQPPLSRRTIYNRRNRGYDSTVPLFESGEFADSFEVEVEAV
jgi:hypothetical protein